jgi:hypothetical protein
MQFVPVTGVSGFGLPGTAEQSGITNLTRLSYVQKSLNVAVDSAFDPLPSGAGSGLDAAQDC